MKVLIQKPDLDTCLTALILGVHASDDIIVLSVEASSEDLENPRIICIEAGGSGRVDLNNYDHHLPGQYFPPACRQALNCHTRFDKKLSRLVDYVCMVDEAMEGKTIIPFPSLSSLFSGMLLVEKLPLSQFRMGMAILKKVLESGIDPFTSMPDLPEWRPFIAAKKENQQEVKRMLDRARFFTSYNGLKIGFLETQAIGGDRALYNQGCQVVILFNPAFGEPPVRKFTIAGNLTVVSHLIPLLNKMEPGWGGRETIIGSPRTGSHLLVDSLLDVVTRYT